MKSQNLFSEEKNKENILKCLLKLLPTMLSMNPCYAKKTSNFQPVRLLDPGC